jgi:hypothetical protein
VKTGFNNDAFIEITSGLKEGDLVLLAPVSDEEPEESEEAPSGETNHVDSAATPNGTQPGEEPRGEGRRFQRRNSEPNDGEAMSERPRNGQGRRRSQNSPDGPQ